jgi:hypothetical protein
MKDLPNPFWALLFMLLGCVLLLAVLVKVTSTTTQLELGVLMAVATAGTSIISGAFGYIQGRKDGEHAVQVPLNPPTQTQVTVTQSPEKEN